jgi:hypothetical protein
VMRRDAVSRADLDRLITEVRERLVPIHSSARTRNKRATSKLAVSLPSSGSV